MRGRKVQGSVGVAEFTKKVAEFTKIAFFGLFACRNERNFVYLPCHFQPKTENIVQNDVL